jgi:hypothetical protein
MISARTKAALKAAKVRGVVLGNPRLAKRNLEHADKYAESLGSIVAELAHLPSRKIVDELTALGVATFRGGRWQSPTVLGLLKRLGLSSGPQNSR